MVLVSLVGVVRKQKQLIPISVMANFTQNIQQNNKNFSILNFIYTLEYGSVL